MITLGIDFLLNVVHLIWLSGWPHARLHLYHRCLTPNEIPRVEERKDRMKDVQSERAKSCGCFPTPTHTMAISSNVFQIMDGFERKSIHSLYLKGNA